MNDMNIFRLNKQGKKEESVILTKRTTLPPTFPPNKKGGGKGTEIISIHSVPG